MIGLQTIPIITGDDWAYQVTCRDTDGNPQDLTGMSIECVADIEGWDISTPISVALDDDPTTGVFVLSLTSEETAQLRHGYTYIADVSMTREGVTRTTPKFGLECIRGITNANT